jgi:hypothetical protein
MESCHIATMEGGSKIEQKTTIPYPLELVKTSKEW